MQNLLIFDDGTLNEGLGNEKKLREKVSDYGELEKMINQKKNIRVIKDLYTWLVV